MSSATTTIPEAALKQVAKSLGRLHLKGNVAVGSIRPANTTDREWQQLVGTMLEEGKANQTFRCVLSLLLDELLGKNLPYDKESGFISAVVKYSRGFNNCASTLVPDAAEVEVSPVARCELLLFLVTEVTTNRILQFQRYASVGALTAKPRRTDSSTVEAVAEDSATAVSLGKPTSSQSAADGDVTRGGKKGSKVLKVEPSSKPEPIDTSFPVDCHTGTAAFVSDGLRLLVVHGGPAATKLNPNARSFKADLATAISARIASAGPDALTPVLHRSALSAQDQLTLNQAVALLSQEYEHRRRNAISRVKETLATFALSSEASVDKVALRQRSDTTVQRLSAQPAVSIDSIFDISAIEVTAFFQKVSSRAVAFQKRNFLVTEVPDRGGRVNTATFDHKVDVARRKADLDMRGKTQQSNRLKQESAQGQQRDAQTAGVGMVAHGASTHKQGGGGGRGGGSSGPASSRDVAQRQDDVRSGGGNWGGNSGSGGGGGRGGRGGYGGGRR